MHRLLIENYIKQIKKEDIYKFGIQNDISLSDDEVDILYHYLNNNWQDLLYGNSRSIFSDMEKRIDRNKFLKIRKLFDEYFNKYQDFLQ